MRSLHSGSFLPGRPDVLLVGGMGTGKTHFAIAIAVNVVLAGARGRYFNTVDLVNRLEEETRLGKAGALAAQLSRLDLVVLDELGYLPLARSGGQLLFHLVSKLYEQTSIIGVQVSQSAGTPGVSVTTAGVTTLGAEATTTEVDATALSSVLDRRSSAACASA